MEDPNGTPNLLYSYISRTVTWTGSRSESLTLTSNHVWDIYNVLMCHPEDPQVFARPGGTDPTSLSSTVLPSF